MKIDSPILKGLEAHIKRKKFNFSMPGHHQHAAYLHLVQEKLLAYDVTENLDTDNLYQAQEFLHLAMEKMAQDRGAKRSFFLVNSSTTGILASLLALCQPGDKVLIEEGSHQSIEHGIFLAQGKKILVPSSLDQPAPQEAYLEALKEHSDCRLVFLTNPNYFGYSIPFKDLASYCQKHGIFLLVDEAHGAHFKYHPDLPVPALEQGAQISIQSFHKTLPSLTQTGVMNFSNHCPNEIIERVLSYLQMIQTSSPSYLFMLSLDLARAYMADHGVEKMKALKSNLECFKKNLTNPQLSLVSNQSIPRDFTKILLSLDQPWQLEKHLFQEGYHIEMITENHLLIITTIMDQKEDLLSLAHCLNSYQELEEDQAASPPPMAILGQALTKNIYQYPPGNILYKKGSILTKEDILLLEKKKRQGIRLINYQAPPST